MLQFIQQIFSYMLQFIQQKLSLSNQIPTPIDVYFSKLRYDDYNFRYVKRPLCNQFCELLTKNFLPEYMTHQDKFEHSGFKFADNSDVPIFPDGFLLRTMYRSEESSSAYISCTNDDETKHLFEIKFYNDIMEGLRVTLYFL